MTSPLQTRTAQNLMTDPIEERPMLIHGLMGDGLGFLCAASKSGKSWLAMEIGICVATGTPLWGYQVRKGAVLHLPLEDTYQRITQCLWGSLMRLTATCSLPRRPMPWPAAFWASSQISTKATRTSRW